MHIDDIRSAVRATIAAVAPETDVQTIVPDRPLREQIDLDSMDWLNMLAGLQDRLQVDIPESDHGRLATLDAIVAYVASRIAEPPAAAREAVVGRPAGLSALHTVDGTPVTVRPIHAEDAALEAGFVRRLSDESRYMRFMATLRELPAAKLRSLTDVDFVHHVALVATTSRDGQEVLLGVARYIVDPDGTGCEFAIAVADEWQGSGLAGILMNALMDTARSRGLTRMEGIVLATNRRMLKFVRQLGFSLQRDPDDRQTLRAARAL